jgi:DNA topoisomerase-3
MYILVVTEKPSVAASIAAVLNAKKREGGFFSGNGYLVSWCIGHLLELAPPDAYGKYAKWRYADLPIIPQTWKHVPAKDKEAQLKILKDLMNRTDVDCVINACDAGREGVLIFRHVYEYANCKKPLKHLWISSMEDAAIKAGFDKLRDGAELDNLHSAASCRERADWIVGISATRAFTCLYGASSVLNVGRVQTPTLAMLVKRAADIDGFVTKRFYTVELDNGNFTASSGRFDDRATAESVMGACNNATVIAVRETEKSAAPPKLYDLTTLQREANRAHGYTAQQTLDYAQSLYEKKYITYPRTNSRFLTDDMAAGVTALIAVLVPDAPCDVSQVINAKKVTDHHAIIPTSESVNMDISVLPGGEREILDMLTNRLICAVGEKHRYLETVVTLKAGGVEFTAKGKTVLHDGWKTTAKPIPNDEGEDEERQHISGIAEGQTVPVTAYVKEGATTPPKHYTEDTLLSAMENAGAEDMPIKVTKMNKTSPKKILVTEDAERKGLGTPATRAAIIEKLIKSGFAERSKKSIIAKDKGRNLIAVLPETLTSAKLTAEWEERMLQIEKGELDASSFMGDIASFITVIVRDNNAPKPEFAALFSGTRIPAAESLGICPRCGSPVRGGAKGFFCDSHTCGFKIWRESKFWTAKKKPLTAAIVAALLKDGHIAIKNLYSEKTGKKYDATVILDDTGDGFVNFKLDFAQGGRK